MKAKTNQNSQPRQVLAFDIGGTKIRSALIDEKALVQKEKTEPTVLHLGVSGLIHQLREIIINLSQNETLLGVGIGCAGPLDGRTGELLDPTNFFTNGQSWGRVPLLAPLREIFPQWPFFLDNDASAAVLGEDWLNRPSEPHRHTNKNNLLVICLGTGVGVGVLSQGQLIRTAQGLHPESSHIPLNINDPTAPCGCGQYGCIEAYLSGPNFVQRLSIRWNEPLLSSQQLLQRAQLQEQKVLEALNEYGETLAHALRALITIYGQHHISLTGGFTAFSPWFLTAAKTKLHHLLSVRPPSKPSIQTFVSLKVSTGGNQLGILGAAQFVFKGLEAKRSNIPRPLQK
ncbi:MAG: ROK family protein [Bdellovibrionales bacterium]|nr:ROK family protein [Bdellovibrionales bacterium]